MSNSFLDEALARMRTDGLLIENPIADGKLHRCPTQDKPRSMNGAYIIHDNKYPVAWWQNWETGASDTHSARSRSEMTAKEKKEFRKLQEENRRKAEETYKKSLANGAKGAQALWNSAAVASNDFPYLQAKGVPAIGLGVHHNKVLLVPLYNGDDKLQAVQRIYLDKSTGNFEKRFSGKAGGCYFSLPAKPGAGTALLIAEGYATGASLREATGYEVWIAFNAGNLGKAARLALQRYPERKICPCADYDIPKNYKEKEMYPEPGGIGVAKARDAAMAISGYLAICPSIDGGATDFNDLHQRYGLPRVKEVIEAALADKPQAAKPKIIYRAGELPRLVKEIEASIKGKAWRLNDLLVRIAHLPEARSYRGLKQAKGTSVISPFEAASLALLASKCAEWVRIRTSGKGDAEVPINPPNEVIQVFLAAKDDWTLPPLTGLVTCPVIRPDGSILDEPGYDAITGLYADFDASFCPIAANPDKRAALDALDILKSSIDEFPFKTGVDQAVVLAAMLTAVLRPSVKSAPLFAFSAPCPGTGKSALADLIGIMATGKPCAAMDFNRDEAEFKKSLIATLLEGSPVTLIDNIVGELNNSLLNMILSQETISGRILGLSKNAKLNTTSLWLATGNNLEICGDLTRRTLLCTLDAETERPAERIFKRDIYQWGLDHRGELAGAALAILRAYHIAGKPLPDGIRPMNGFNDWSRWIRGALLWLGEADPKESQLEIEAHDPEREGLRAVLTAWHKHFGNGFVTTKDLLAREAPDGCGVQDTQLDLYQTLLDAVPYGRELTGKKLGNWLAKHEGRVIDGLKLINTGEKRQNFAYWKVTKI